MSKSQDRNERIFSGQNLLIVFLLLLAILVNRIWFLPRIDTHVFRGVPNFYTWITIWNCHALESLNLSDYWSGNAMYPYPFAFAFSENMIGITPFSAPIWFLTRNPILTANLLSILLLWLTAAMTFFMIKKLIGDSLPALVAALIFSLYPWTLKAFSLGRFHLLGLMWLPIIMYANWKFWESGLKRYLPVMVFFWVWTFLINIYMGIFLGIFLGVWNLVWFFYHKKNFSLKKIFQWIAGVFLVWILMMPIFLYYQHVGRDMGMVRTLENQIQYTGPIWSWITVSDENWMWGHTLKFLPAGKPDGIVENHMFPGFIVIGFFIISFFIRKMPVPLKSLRLTGLILFVLAMGPFTLGIPWKIPLPFSLLWYLYPPLQATRNPHRLSVFVVMIIAVLASFIIKEFFKLKRLKVLGIIIISLGIGIESMGIVKPRPALLKDAKAFYTPLKRSLGKHTIVELPINIHTDLRAMVSSVFHWNRLVNGVSGLWPPLQTQLEGEMREFPSAHSIQILQSLEVDRIVIHETQYRGKRRILLKQVQQYPEIKLINRRGFTSLWSLEKGDVRHDFRGEKDLTVSSASSCVSGKINFSLDVIPAKEDIVFNRKAPSQFSFTPTRLWEVETAYAGTDGGLTRSSWRSPALFHPYNWRKKIELELTAGHHKLVIGVDMMGEKVRLFKTIDVIPVTHSFPDVPGYLRLAKGYTGKTWADLKVQIQAEWINSSVIDKEKKLNARVYILNPGPYYWTCSTGEGIFLGARLVSDGKVRVFEFELPHDLFPGDTAICLIQVPLPEKYEKAALYLNCFGKSQNIKKWFPGENRVRFWNFPDIVPSYQD